MRPLALLAAAFLTASPALTQDWRGLGRVEGKVTDAQGHPIAGAVLKLELPSRGQTTLRSDKKGRWVAGGIAAGDWNADVEAPGYVTRRIRFTLATESQRLTGIDVKLEAAAPQGPPPEVLAALQAADDAYKAGRHEDALAEYRKLLTLRPDLATTIHQQMGFSLIQLKKYPEALDHLQKVLDADPANHRMRAIMAQAAVEGGLTERGLALLDGLDESAVDSPDLYFNVGVGFVNANKPEEALVYFTKSIAKDPAYADGYFRRGLAALQLGRTAEAKADLVKLLELRPEGPEADLARKALEQLK